MPSPIVHSILPTCLLVSTGLPKTVPKREAAKLIALAVFLGNSPDFDLIPALFDDRLWNHVHRWYGHNIFSLVALTLFGKWLLGRFVPTLPKKTAWYAAIGLVLSHPLLDGMVHPQMIENGVPLFFPFSYRTFHMPYWLFGRSYHAEGHHKLLGYAVSNHNWQTVFGYEVLMIVTLLTLLFCTKRAIYLVQKIRARRAGYLSSQS